MGLVLDLGGAGRKRVGRRDRPTAVRCDPVQCLTGVVPGAL